MKNKARILFAIALLLSATLLASNAHAATAENVDLTVNVPAVCSLSATNNHLVKTINPGTADTVGIANLKAFCNDANGFAIYTVGYTNDTYGNKYLVTDQGDEYKIDTGLGNTGDTSNWNMTIDNDTSVANNYTATIENDFDSAHVIPETFTKVASLNSATDHFVGANLTVQVDAYASPHQIAGAYTGKIKFTLIHPSTNASTPDELYSMQNVQNWEHKIATGQTINAVDERDGRVYKVSRLLDGNLWMMENLDLGRTDIFVDLDSSNTHMPEGATFSAATVNSWRKTTFNNEWMSDTEPELIPITVENFVTGSDTDSYGNHYGTLYNYAAASAGTIVAPDWTNEEDAEYDLCPSGWRLPTGGPNTSNNDVVVLITSYGGLSTNMNDNTNPTGAEMSTILQETLGFSLAGGFGGDFVLQNSKGMYWTSTRANRSSMFTLTLGTSEFIYNNGNSRPAGSSVRCLASKKTMQTVGSWGSSVAQGETVTAIDERDGEEYTVARLADGKLWTTKNLRLDFSKFSEATAEEITTLESQTNNPAEGFFANAKTIASSNEWCVEKSSECINQVKYNTDNIGDTEHIDSDQYTYDEYGVYYNWYTATAGRGTYELSTLNEIATGDLCPHGWHLPAGSNKDILDQNEWWQLATNIIGAEPLDTTGTTSFPGYQDESSEGLNAANMLSSEANLPFSGYFWEGLNGRDYLGAYWTSTATSAGNALRTYFQKGGYAYPGTGGMQKYRGFSIRCLAE